MRYGWEPTGLPTSCVCGKSFTIDHCLSCSHGGYTITRHNELRNITANLLQKVCPDVQVEPTLQPLSGEHLLLRSSNRNDGACLDVAATNLVWTHNQQHTYFDVRVFNPLVPSNSQSLALCYKKHEQEKRRRYDQRIWEVEHGSFTPLVFNTMGGIGPTATVVFKRIASMIADKTSQSYTSIICLIRCILTFSLLRSTITCLRGSWSLWRNEKYLSPSDADLALAEGRVHLWLITYNHHCFFVIYSSPTSIPLYHELPWNVTFSHGKKITRWAHVIRMRKSAHLNRIMRTFPPRHSCIHFYEEISISECVLLSTIHIMYTVCY